MMMAWNYYFAFYLFLFVNGKETRNTELKMANVLYRHGDRSPIGTFPIDEHRNYWKQGLGQLTEIGMSQEFHMGQFLKQRYIPNLLNQTYLRKQVYCRSTDTDRTLMSAEAQMAGLYPPIYNKSILPKEHAWQFWQLIPIHTFPKQCDKLLRPYGYECPRLKQIQEESYHDPAFVKMDEEHRAFFKMISDNLGLKTPLTLKNMSRAWDFFFCQRAHNLSWPNWMTSEIFTDMTMLYHFGLAWLFNTPEKCRLTGGVLLGEMVENMKKFKQHPDSSKKLHVYSAHDTTVVGLLSALKLYTGISPPYSTTFLMELYYDKTASEYYVRMFYRNDTSLPYKTYELVLPGCESNICTLEKFISLTASAIPVDYEAECISNTPYSHLQCKKSDHLPCRSTLAAVVILLLLLLIAVVVFGVRRCQMKRKAKAISRFQHVETEDWDSE